jgi:hypothetical protein
MQTRAIVVLIATAVLSNAAMASGPELVLGSAQSQAGQMVTVPVTYKPGGGRTAVALATDVRFNPATFQNPRCEAGSALIGSNASKSVRCAEPKTGVLRLAIFGLNTEPVPAGEVARITFNVSADARPRAYRLRQKPTAADAAGKDFLLRRRDGTVRVSK